MSAKSIFDTLNAVNVNGHTEKKKNGKDELTYLSWAWAWAETVKRYPDVKYKILTNADGDHFFSSKYGIEVRTEVTIGGETREMWLPVMDGANHAMKDEPYSYTVKGWDGKPITKTVKAASMMDINKAIMRCLTKNLAMFGLGLYIYAGEDLPESVEDDGERKPNAEEAAKTPQDAPEAEKVSTPTPTAKKPVAKPQAAKSAKNPKMVQAWKEFGALESSKSLADTAKTKLFCGICKEHTGKSDPNSLDDADWDNVLQAIDIMRIV